MTDNKGTTVGDQTNTPKNLITIVLVTSLFGVIIVAMLLAQIIRRWRKIRNNSGRRQRGVRENQNENIELPILNGHIVHRR
ncbi:unnamed protein product [Clavelina lepadiformis]|uniref:Uncharacterized protein n=1 Tax=Clavelina lepadiformis TaxID=159417 RepID=A0ABP0GEW8_CLALP